MRVCVFLESQYFNFLSHPVSFYSFSFCVPVCVCVLIGLCFMCIAFCFLCAAYLGRQVSGACVLRPCSLASVWGPARLGSVAAAAVAAVECDLCHALSVVSHLNTAWLYLSHRPHLLIPSVRCCVCVCVCKRERWGVGFVVSVCMYFLPEVCSSVCNTCVFRVLSVLHVCVSVCLTLPARLSQAREHRKFAVAEGDHLTMLNVYEAFIKVRRRLTPEQAIICRQTCLNSLF